MTETACPRCGFNQDGGEECLRCGVIFRRARAKPETSPSPFEPPRRPAQPRPAPVGAARERPQVLEETPRPSVFWRVYRVFRWAALLSLIVVIVLMLRQDKPPEVASDATALRRVGAKMAEADRAVAIGSSYTLALDEVELNALLAQTLALAPPAGSERPASPQEPSLEEVRSNVRDMRVQLVDDRVVAWLLFDFHGKELTLTLEAELSARDGRLHIAPTGGWLGRLPLPQAASDRAVGRALADPANAAKLGLPPELRDIRVEGSQLVLDWGPAGPSAPAWIAP